MSSPHPRTGRTTPSPRVVLSAALTLAVAFTASLATIPLYAGLRLSFESLCALFGMDLWPTTPTSADWSRVLHEWVHMPWGPHQLGTLVSSMLVVAISLFLGVTAHYAFGRARLRTRASTLFLVGATLLPPLALLSTLFEATRLAEHYSHWWGLHTPYLTFSLPVAIWASVAFSGRPPGSPLPLVGIWRRALWPRIQPAFLAALMIAFIAACNEWLFALTTLRDSTQHLLPHACALEEEPSGLLPLVLIGLGVAAAALAAERRRLRSLKRARA